MRCPQSLFTYVIALSGTTVGMFLPVANTISSENMGAYITVVLLEVAAAIVITFLAGPARLSRIEPEQRYEEWLQDPQEGVSNAKKITHPSFN